MVYLETGFFDNNNPDTFPTPPRNRSRFSHLSPNQSDIGYTNQINLAIPNFPENSTSVPVSSYIKLIYIKLPRQCSIRQTAPSNPLDPHVDYFYEETALESFANTQYPITAINSVEYVDHLFLPLSMQRESPWPPDNNRIQSNIFYDRHLIDLSRFTGRACIAHRGIAQIPDPANPSQPNITLFAFASDRDGFNANSLRDTSLPYLSGSDSNESPDAGNPIDSYENWLRTKFPRIFNYSTPIIINFPLDGRRRFFSLDNSLVSFTSSMTKPTDGDYIAIHINGVDWVNIINLATSSFDQRFKVYLGLSYDSSSVQNDTTGASHRFVRYEIVLRGYILNTIRNTVELQEIPTNVYHYCLLTSFDLIQNIGSMASNSPVNRVFSIQSNGNKRTIENKIYLARGMGVSPSEFCRYINYYRENILQVWTTNDGNFGNRGLEGIVDSTGSPVMMSALPDANANSVEFCFTTPAQYNRLLDREIFTQVDRNPGRSRSFTTGNRRGMYMVFRRPVK